MARPKIFPCPSALVARRVIDVIALLLLMTPVPGRAAEAQAIVAAYRATWAGLPAGEIRLSLRQSDGDGSAHSARGASDKRILPG